MNGRGDRSERRTFAVVMAVVFGAVLTMMLLTPGDDADAALTATARRTAASGAAPTIASARPTTHPFSIGRVEAVPMRDPVELAPLLDDRLGALVHDLRDDGIRGNAGRAVRVLIQLPAGEIPELVAALDSNDLQLRHFAAGVLRRRCLQQRASVPDRLLQVSVEALRSGLGPVKSAAYSTWVGPLLVRSAHFLREHAEAASPMLLRELTSIDPQQRFLSAYLLAQGGLVSRTRNSERVGRVAYELLGHLGDNNISGDALMATHGLYRIGDMVLPVLLENRRYLDEQGRQLIDLIRLDLKQPPRTKKDFYQRGASFRISSIYHDPAVEYDMRRSVVPRFGGR